MNIDVQQLVEQIADEADATANDPMPPGVTSSRPNKSVPVAVRLTPEDVAAIVTLAERLDIPMSSLIRGWILTALNAQRQESVTTALDRINADVQRLRELVA